MLLVISLFVVVYHKDGEDCVGLKKGVGQQLLKVPHFSLV